MSVRIVIGDCRQELAEIPSASVQAVVTSPPYYGLRDYDHPDQIGLEASPEAYVEGLVGVFREVRRVLRPDDVLWLNLGDSYAGGGNGGHQTGGCQGKTGQMRDRAHAQAASAATSTLQGRRDSHTPRFHGHTDRGIAERKGERRKPPGGLKPKDLIGIPWRVAFALQADGWWLRQEIIWHKPNPMPESVLDRCTKAHEHVFMLTKSRRYYFDAAAIAEPTSEISVARANRGRSDDHKWTDGPGDQTIAREPPSAGRRRVPGNKSHKGTTAFEEGDQRHRTKAGLVAYSERAREAPAMMSNRRTVWSIASEPSPIKHFAMMPTALARDCIAASTRPGDLVLDPFAGPGTTGLAADRLQRHALLIELNPAFAEIARGRISGEAPLLADVA